MARIVHICPRYAPAHGGVELFFRRLSEALVARGHEVSVWTTDTATVQGFTVPSGARLSAGPELIDGVEVRRFPVRYLPAQRYLRTLANLLPLGVRWTCDTLRWTPLVPALTAAAGRPSQAVDLVHVAGLPYSSLVFAGVRLAARARAPLVISPFTHVAHPGPAGDRMTRAYLSPLNLALLRKADRLFVQTAFERDVLAAAGLRAAHQAVVGLGVDADGCTGGDRAAFRAAHGIPIEAVVVAHLANKSWDKGTVDLLDAAERLWDRDVPFVLVLAGSEMPTFRARWSRVRHRNRVVNLGHLSDAERRDFYAAADLFALPSYVESFGISPLEAALNGAAVLAWDHGGPAQIFHDGVDATLVPVADAGRLASSLEHLVIDTATRRRLGAAAQQLARTFTWERVLAVAVAEYERLLAH